MGVLKDVAVGMGRALVPTQTKTFTLQNAGVQSTWTSLLGPGISAGSREIIAAFSANPNIRRCVGLIADSLVSSPFFLRKRDGSAVSTSKRFSRFYRALLSKDFRTQIRDDVSEPIYDHPFLEFLYRGCKDVDGVAGLETLYAYDDLKGNSYLWWTPEKQDFRDQRVRKSDIPYWWRPVAPQDVIQAPGAEGGEWLIRVGTQQIKVHKDRIQDNRCLNLSDLYGRGVGIGDALKDEIDTDEYAANLMRHLIANKGFSDVIISILGEGQSVDAQARMLEQQYNARHRGFYNTGRAMVVGQEVDIKPVTHSLSELRLLELRQWERDVIRETFRIPPELLGLVENSNRSTSATAERNYAVNVLVPRLNKKRLWLQFNILPLFDPAGEYLVDYHSPVPEDAELRLETMKVTPQAYTINEWRAMSGHAPLGEGGDELVQPKATPTITEQKALGAAAGPFALKY